MDSAAFKCSLVPRRLFAHRRKSTVCVYGVKVVTTGKATITSNLRTGSLQSRCLELQSRALKVTVVSLMLVSSGEDTYNIAMYCSRRVLGR